MAEHALTSTLGKRWTLLRCTSPDHKRCTRCSHQNPNRRCLLRMSCTTSSFRQRSVQPRRRGIPSKGHCRCPQTQAYTCHRLTNRSQCAYLGSKEKRRHHMELRGHRHRRGIQRDSAHTLCCFLQHSIRCHRLCKLSQHQNLHRLCHAHRPCTTWSQHLQTGRHCNGHRRLNLRCPCLPSPVRTGCTLRCRTGL